MKTRERHTSFNGSLMSGGDDGQKGRHTQIVYVRPPINDRRRSRCWRPVIWRHGRLCPSHNDSVTRKTYSSSLLVLLVD